MGQNKKAIPEVENVQNYLQGVAKNLVDRLYGPQGPPEGTKMTQLEDVVLAIRNLLSEEILDQALQRQAQADQTKPPESICCPSCSGPVQPADPEPRIVCTRAGEAQWSEPQYFCRRCRRAFFPSVQEFGD